MQGIEPYAGRQDWHGGGLLLSALYIGPCPWIEAGRLNQAWSGKDPRKSPGNQPCRADLNGPSKVFCFFSIKREEKTEGLIIGNILLNRPSKVF